MRLSEESTHQRTAAVSGAWARGHTGEGHWEVGGRGKSKGTTDSSKGTFLMPSVKECFTPSLLLAVRLRHNSIRAYIPSSGNAQC